MSRVCTVLCACLIWNKGLPPPFSLSLTMSAALLTRAKARGEEVRRRTGRRGLCWKRCQNYSLQGESDPAVLCPRHLAVLFRLGVQPHPLPVILPCCSYDDGAVFPPGCPSSTSHPCLLSDAPRGRLVNFTDSCHMWLGVGKMKLALPERQPSCSLWAEVSLVPGVLPCRLSGWHRLQCFDQCNR